MARKMTHTLRPRAGVFKVCNAEVKFCRCGAAPPAKEQQEDPLQGRWRGGAVRIVQAGPGGTLWSSDPELRWSNH